MLYILCVISIISSVFSADSEEQTAVSYAGATYDSPFKPCLPEKAPPPPIEPPPASLPALAVEGVVWAGLFPQVIINGKIIKEGDKISKVEILKIERDKIRILFEGKEFFLKTKLDKGGDDENNE